VKDQFCIFEELGLWQMDGQSCRRSFFVRESISLFWVSLLTQ